jgi:5-deoxy-glucuronate isomerase
MTGEAPIRLHHAAGSLAEGPWSLTLTPEQAGWAYTGLRTADLRPGEQIDFDTGHDELLLIPIAGSFEIEIDGAPFTLAGRIDVWNGPTDFLYCPPGSAVSIDSPAGGRLAIPSARAETRRPSRHIPAADVRIELRGRGSCSREVRWFADPVAFEADRIIAVEVLTPSGNWSSYPPHKHDEASPDETELEEIYWYQVADGLAGPGIAYQRVYGTPARPIDVLAEVRGGDLVLIPHGWHGPSMAAPGYDLYYLNAMAGPGERAWRATMHPAHNWVTEAMSDQEIDPRLPFGSRG